MFVISVSATKSVKFFVGRRYAVSVLLAFHTRLPPDTDGAFVPYILSHLETSFAFVKSASYVSERITRSIGETLILYTNKPTPPVTIPT